MTNQVGTYKQPTTGREVSIKADTSAPGAWVPVLLKDTYYPSNRPDWPVRGGLYMPGETASFPAAEAAAMVAAGIAANV